jgi:hypothetical protein
MDRTGPADAGPVLFFYQRGAWYIGGNKGFIMSRRGDLVLEFAALAGRLDEDVAAAVWQALGRPGGAAEMLELIGLAAALPDDVRAELVTRLRAKLRELGGGVRVVQTG